MGNSAFSAVTVLEDGLYPGGFVELGVGVPVITGVWEATPVEVQWGGTGASTFTAYSLICAGTTALGPFQNVATLGTSGQVLTSAGAGALPTWATPTTGTVTSVSGTANRITSTGGATPVIDISASYVGQSSITTLGTITTGVWNGTAVTVANGGTGNTTFTAYSVICAGTTATGVFQNVSGVGTSGQILTSNGAGSLPTWQSGAAGTVTSVSGTANRITSTGGTTPVIDISASYVGQSSLTTLGTITTGVWNGTAITVANGGTGNTTFTAYSVICAGTTATGIFQNVSGVGTSGQVLTSNGASALPTWQAAAAGTVTSVSGTANRITSTGGATPVIDISASYVGQSSITTLGTITTGVWNGTAITVANGGTGNTTFTAYSVICAGTTATGVFQNVSGVGSSGQVLTSGGASALPTWSNPTSGTIVNQNSSSVTMVAGNQYFINNGASLVTLTLPTSAAQGDTFIIVGGSSGGWKVAQNASQTINLNSTPTTTGTGGSLQNTNLYNCITIKCITANTTFVVSNVCGVITVV